MNDVFELLMQDHREVERMFSEYERTSDYAMALEICQELSIHAVVEEEAVYPLYRAKVETAGADEAAAEHQEAKELIMHIESLGADDPGVAEAVAALKASVMHHVEEEESELFPKMEAKLPDLTAGLGAEVRERKEQLKAKAAEVRALGLPPSQVAEKPVAVHY